MKQKVIFLWNCWYDQSIIKYNNNKIPVYFLYLYFTTIRLIYSWWTADGTSHVRSAPNSMREISSRRPLIRKFSFVQVMAYVTRFRQEYLTIIESMLSQIYIALWTPDIVNKRSSTVVSFSLQIPGQIVFKRFF